MPLSIETLSDSALSNLIGYGTSSESTHFDSEKWHQFLNMSPVECRESVLSAINASIAATYQGFPAKDKPNLLRHLPLHVLARIVMLRHQIVVIDYSSEQQLGVGRPEVPRSDHSPFAMCGRTEEPRPPVDGGVLACYLAPDSWSQDCEDKLARQGLYSIDEYDLKAIVRRYATWLKSMDMKELFEILMTFAPSVKICRHRDLVAVRNGVFDYSTKKLHLFTPDLVFVTKCNVELPWPGDPNPVEPVIEVPGKAPWSPIASIRETYTGEGVADALLKVIGAVLRPYNKWEKAVFLYNNAGSNGKGTILELLRSLVGENSHDSIPLDQWSETFALTGIETKSLIAVDEQDVGSFSPKVSNFKSAVTGDVLRMDVKYKNPRKARFYGLIVMCMNDIPQTKDTTDSWYRRHLWLPANARFVGGDKRPEIKADFFKRREVLDYIAWYVLTQIPDYYELEEPESARELLLQVKDENDTVRAFLADCLDRFAWDFVPNKFLHDLYVAWMRRNNPSGRPVNSLSVARSVRQYLADNPDDWEYSDNPVTAGKNMRAPEMMILEYRLDGWRNSKAFGTDELACTPNPSVVGRQRGIVRKVPRIQDDPVKVSESVVQLPVPQPVQESAYGVMSHPTTAAFA